MIDKDLFFGFMNVIVGHVFRPKKVHTFAEEKDLIPEGYVRGTNMATVSVFRGPNLVAVTFGENYLITFERQEKQNGFLPS